MATQREISKQLFDTIDKAIGNFNSAIPERQRQLLAEIEVLLKGLELNGNNIKQSVNNLRLIAAIKTKLEQAVNSPAYLRDVSDYLKSFDTITRLQNEYFGTLKRDFSPSPLLGEIRKQSLDSAFESLTANGINKAITTRVQDLLRQNITAGSSYTKTMQQVRDYLTDNSTGQGAMARYTKQITTDALNQYSAQYTNAVTNDLGLDWFQYTGALIDTSRTLCEALIAKKWVHKSELPDIVKGNFPEFKERHGKLNDKTGLPEGMIAGTNAQNFHIYRGGYQCGHQLLPADESGVPVSVRIATYTRLGIKHVNGVKKR